jgi:hypothetical protein
MNTEWLEKRLEDDARAWRRKRPRGPELGKVLARIDLIDNRTMRRRPRPSLLLTAAILLAAIVGTSLVAIDHGSATVEVGTASVATCGSEPVSFGAYPRELAIKLIAPRTATAGTTIHPSLQVRSLDGLPHSVDDAAQPVESVVVYRGKVVGKYKGTLSGTGFAFHLSGHEMHSIPTNPLLLSGCTSGHVNSVHPNATRKPLPPGKYELEAALVADSGNWQLVSPPESVTIRSN